MSRGGIFEQDIASGFFLRSCSVFFTTFHVINAMVKHLIYIIPFLVFSATHGLLAQRNIVAGQVQDVHGSPMSGVTIRVFTDKEVLVQEVKTDSLGCFYAAIPKDTPFKSLLLRSSYAPAVTANYINTLDLIRLNHHILGIAPLEHPYHTLAADVNGSQSITTFDVIQLRNWLLGKTPDSLHQTAYEHFAPNTWQFVDTTTLNDIRVGGAGDQHTIQIKRSELPQYHLVLVGFTSGNVASSVASDRRPAAVLEWPVLSAEKANPTITVPVVYRGPHPATGMQFGLSFDTMAWRLVGPSLGDVTGVTEDNFGLDQQNQGKIRFCWVVFEGESSSAQPGETLFYLTFSAKHPLRSNHAGLQLDITLLPGGIWTADATEYEITPVTAAFEPIMSSTESLVTLKRTPTSNALIFNSDRVGKIRVVVSDGWGRQISFRDIPVQAGLQEVILDDLSQQNPGLYSWWIKLPNGKMQRGNVVINNKKPD